MASLVEWLDGITETPVGSDEVMGNRLRQAEKRVGELWELNEKRMTKIRRLRQGIRSLQACHERDQREIQNLRQKLAQSGIWLAKSHRTNEKLRDQVAELNHEIEIWDERFGDQLVIDDD